MSKEHQLVIIGGGPGGYVCAIRAAQLGIDTAIIELRSNLGGTCVNVGCIPSKALLDSSHKFHDSQSGLASHGIEVTSVKLDLSQMMARKDKIVKELTDGLDYLIKKNNIQRYQGLGSFKKISQVGSEANIHLQVSNKDGQQELITRHCVIATGSQTIQLPSVQVDGNRIIHSDHAIALDKVPKKLAIIGGGVIGLELGSVWKRLGAEVTIIEALPSILMGLDKPTRDLCIRLFKAQGLRFLFESKVLGAKKKSKSVEITIEDKTAKQQVLEADVLLVAVGRRPYTEGLDAQKIGVQLNTRGRIEVNPQNLATNVPGVYAIGDAIEGPMLAHRAQDEGVMVAEKIAGKVSHVNYQAVPWIVYTWPEVAWVGSSEDILKEQGIKYKVGRCLFRANGRAKAMNEADGQIKILADEHDDRILGVSIVGPNASELIAEAAIAIEFGASAEDIARSFHGHPTLSEVMHEAALDVAKRAIHA